MSRTIGSRWEQRFIHGKPLNLLVFYSPDAKCAAQRKRSKQSCKEDNRNHDGHFRLSKRAGCGSHRGYDQADFTTRNHAAANTEASYGTHTARQGSHAATQQALRKHAISTDFNN